MKKVVAKIVPKVWGKEFWLWSPLPEAPTYFEDGTPCANGPLIKILLADEPLPVQVHPDAEMAMKLENMPNGKDESWYVLRTFKENAGFIVGLKDYSETGIKKMLANDTFENNLVWEPAIVGKFYYAPAGIVHAMGGGVEALEVQEPCDLTYRYYDFNRLVDGKLRPMQLEKALKCQKPNVSTKFPPSKRDPLEYDTFYGKQIFPSGPMTAKGEGVAIDFSARQAYFVDKGEMISLKNYAFVQFSGSPIKSGHGK